MSNPDDRPPLSIKFKRTILERDDYACQYCGAKGPNVILHVDHVIPIAGGGSNDSTNLATACRGCNLSKGSRMPDGSFAGRKRQPDKLANQPTPVKRRRGRPFADPSGKRREKTGYYLTPGERAWVDEQIAHYRATAARRRQASTSEPDNSRIADGYLDRHGFVSP